jgi:uncharacterized protein YyaL (SSP411 family)
MSAAAIEGIGWEEWGPEAFSRSKRERKQVLLRLVSGAAIEPPLASALAEIVSRRFVPVLVDARQRPDVFYRYIAAPVAGEESLPVIRILSGDGEPLYPAAGESDLEAAIRKFAADYQPKSENADAVPAWTGAVGGPSLKELDASFPARSLSRIKNLKAATDVAPQWQPDACRLLTYAASEWADGEALARLEETLAAFGIPATAWEDAPAMAGIARAYWDLHALTGSTAHVRIAWLYTRKLCEEYYDAKEGYFRERPGGGEQPRYADVTAAAVLALLRAADFHGQEHCYDIAEHVLHQLKTKMYDPVLGMIHARTPRTVVYGLLEDNALALLAFTEAFLMTGHKPYREFADELGRLLFQEYWDRDAGGFLDRSPQNGDIGLLKLRRRPLQGNAAALEGIWRLSELKGNANYKKWVRFALQSLTASGGEPDPGLARLQDILTKGRMDFELVGLLSDAKTDALLSALSRQCLPRKIVSFVDPNDQDYILAHKLEAPAYPRLFACGPDLKRLADTDDPAKVPELVKASRQ